ncbi:MAG: MerR family transcriptional regulator [Propionibacteriaceae bacterium]|nr:MerR family transcriptional regulator [Propionibacteriaceae bacterium]
MPTTFGFRGPAACQAVGITYRQLDYWARTGLVVPEIRDATGSGTQRLYSFRDLLLLRVVKRLLDAGISLQQIRAAVDHLRDRGVENLSEVTLLSDGSSIFECTSDNEVLDLLKGSQAMFAIPLGTLWRDLEGTLVELPQRSPWAEPQSERVDELAARRARRAG